MIIYVLSTLEPGKLIILQLCINIKKWHLPSGLILFDHRAWNQKPIGTNMDHTAYTTVCNDPVPFDLDHHQV
jgi:hypothetical protein